jgi:hypothetical protein
MEKFEPVARSHPGLVAVLHLGRAQDRSYFYYIMEIADDVESRTQFDPALYKPHTLSAELNRRGRLPFEECLRIGIALSSALDHLHTRKLVHRDIKPSNIIFVNRTPKLADIGLVSVIGENPSEVGTKGYYLPQEFGTVRADIYSLGKVLYQMATGRAVEGFPELPTHLRDQSVPRMFLLNQIILKSCDLDPRVRYQTVVELHSALVAARDAAVVTPASPKEHFAQSPNPKSTGSTKEYPPSRRAAAYRITILYKPNPELDNHVRDLLETRLGEQDCEVLADKSAAFSVQWAREMEDNIRRSDAVIVLLTAASVESEMLTYEAELAHEAGQRGGKPVILAVRLNYSDRLTGPLANLLDRRPVFEWNTPRDDERLVTELLASLRATPLTAPIRNLPALEATSGAVLLTSNFYIERDADAQFQQAIARRDSIVLVKGARQMGKTSLLARGLQQARTDGGRVVLTDFQKFRVMDLKSVDAFYRALSDFLSDSLGLTAPPDATWDNRRNPTINFERYLCRAVLGDDSEPLVWGMDEVDRLFACDIGGEVFGLFRSWHNERALNPAGPWSRLTLAIAYATEAHLFITDVNQSPFNVGTRIELDDFTLAQLDDLNQRHGAPLKRESDIIRLHQLLGGQPYLTRQGFNHLAEGRLTLDTLVATADRDEGIFGDHLRRIVVLLARDPELTDVVRGILNGRPCPDVASFYRLRSAGVMRGESFQQTQPRCEIYATYFRRHLL